jgi:hypothetical protein
VCLCPKKPGTTAAAGGGGGGGGGGLALIGHEKQSCRSVPPCSFTGTSTTPWLFERAVPCLWARHHCCACAMTGTTSKDKRKQIHHTQIKNRRKTITNHQVYRLIDESITHTYAVTAVAARGGSQWWWRQARSLSMLASAMEGGAIAGSPPAGGGGWRGRRRRWMWPVYVAPSRGGRHDSGGGSCARNRRRRSPAQRGGGGIAECSRRRGIAECSRLRGRDVRDDVKVGVLRQPGEENEGDGMGMLGFVSCLYTK